ncbi:MAG TPA: CCA tRNA nucleotidyltransferase [Phycisphaerae bacterium]
MRRDPSSEPKRAAAEKIVQGLREAGHTALLAGGCVRDLLLGVPPKDYDVATDAPPPVVTQLFRRTRTVGAKFGVVLVRMGGVDVEVATFRSEGAYSDGRRPDTVTFTGPQEDAQRRDFTINGMFYDPVEQRVIDYVGGQDDLKARVLRAIGDPERRFAEDHLRMLRAIRLAARLGFTIDPATFRAIQHHAAELRDISRERIRMELEMILTHASRSTAWTLLHQSGLDAHLMPPAAWDESAALSFAGRLAALPPDARLPTALAAVLRDSAPPQAAEMLHTATYSNETVQDVTWLLASLPALLEPDKLDLADVKLLAADPRFADLLQLAQAEYRVLGRDRAPLERLQARIAALDPESLAPPRLITGEDLLAWGVPAGPVYARVLEQVYRAQLNGTFTTRDEALALARKLAQPDSERLRG